MDTPRLSYPQWQHDKTKSAHLVLVYQPAETRKWVTKINTFCTLIAADTVSECCLKPQVAFFLFFWSLLQIKQNHSLYYSFPFAGLDWSAFHGLKNTVKTLWIPCAGVWQPAIAGPKGELLSRAAGQLKQNHVWTPISTGDGEEGSFNQDLKTGEPLIKTLLCTFILFLRGQRWLMSSTLIPLFWEHAVSDVSLLPITRRSSCDVEEEKLRTLTAPSSPLHPSYPKCVCVCVCGM